MNLLIPGIDGRLEIKILPCKKRDKYGYLLLCFDSQYKDENKKIIELGRVWISIDTVMSKNKKLERVKK